jgi:tetratricopeptide (TPR) repeat protein
MGRVYATQRHKTRAIVMTEDAYKIRRELGREYRIALSLNSRAIVHLEFDEPQPARKRAEDAYRIFEHLGSKRGEGLASITLGRASREMGKQEEWYSFEECVNYFHESIRHLKSAVATFKSVAEPVRLVESLNELGTTYRDLARLYADRVLTDPAKTGEVQAIASQSIRYLEDSVAEARIHGLNTRIIDSLEDMAQSYVLLKDLEKAKEFLQVALEMVPADVFDRRTQVEDALKSPKLFLALMGKIELTQGDILYAEYSEFGQSLPTNRALAEVLEHYMLASAYIEEFSPGSEWLREVFMRLHERFQSCTTDQIEYLAKTVIPEISRKYEFDLNRPIKFFADTFRFPVRPMQS